MADEALMVLRAGRFACGSEDAVLTDVSLQALYGVVMQRVCFEHGGRKVETLVPVLEVEQHSLLQTSSGYHCSRLLKPTTERVTL